MDADNLPSSFRLPASNTLSPLPQGELDGLCGVYSLINAIRLARAQMAPVSSAESAALFSFAVYRLAETGDLRDRICRGVPWQQLKQLGKRMLDVASTDKALMSLKLVHKGGFGRIATMQGLLQNGAPLVGSVHNDEHYSVITGWTRTRALLFDSSGGKWVPINTMRCSLCFAIEVRTSFKSI